MKNIFKKVLISLKYFFNFVKTFSILKTKLIFLIFLSFLFILFISCNNRDDDTNPNLDNYSVEISYIGDLQNWDEDLSISTKVNPDNVPSVNGINVMKLEKIDNENYTFYFPIESLKNKKINTSNGIKEIKISGQLSPTKKTAEEIKVFVKIYKNNIMKDQFYFPFNYNSSFKYYIIHAN
jgi:hypothetical protein